MVEGKHLTELISQDKVLKELGLDKYLINYDKMFSTLIYRRIEIVTCVYGRYNDP